MEELTQSAALREIFLLNGSQNRMISRQAAKSQRRKDANGETYLIDVYVSNNMIDFFAALRLCGFA